MNKNVKNVLKGITAAGVAFGVADLVQEYELVQAAETEAGEILENTAESAFERAVGSQDTDEKIVSEFAYLSDSFSAATSESFASLDAARVSMSEAESTAYSEMNSESLRAFGTNSISDISEEVNSLLREIDAAQKELAGETGYEPEALYTTYAKKLIEALIRYYNPKSRAIVTQNLILLPDRNNKP